MFKQALGEQHPTTVELQLVVEIIQLLLDVCGTRTVVTSAERQQHVDLKERQQNSASLQRHWSSRVHLTLLVWSFLGPSSTNLQV